MGKAASISVDGTGAWPGDRLLGYKNHNQGLVLELMDDLVKRDDGKYGRLEGVKVKVIEAGSGEYKEMWGEFVGKVVDRQEVVSWILEKRETSPEFCEAYPTLNENFNGLNANSLINAALARHEGSLPSQSLVGPCPPGRQFLSSEGSPVPWRSALIAGLAGLAGLALGLLL